MLQESLDVGGFNTYLGQSNSLVGWICSRAQVLARTVKESSGSLGGLTRHQGRVNRQENLLWSRIWIGVGLCCYCGLLRDLLHLFHFRNLCRLCRLSRTAFAI